MGLLFATILLVFLGADGVRAQDAPPLPSDLPVWMIGGPHIDGARLQPFEKVRFALGGASKEAPLGLGEKIQEQAWQELTLRAEQIDGRDVWVRSFETFRVGDSLPVASGAVVMDRATLAPLSATLTQQGDTQVFDYDWNTYLIQPSRDGQVAGDPESLDLVSLEAGAHEVWVAAVDWSSYSRAMIPTVLAGGGGKWWAVPRLVGTEPVDIGDGVERDAWVVEMDWWGMGRDHGFFTPGGGVNGSAGSGGKYWVLQDAPEGVPAVVRIRTEATPEGDRVNQLQGSAGG